MTKAADRALRDLPLSAGRFAAALARPKAVAALCIVAITALGWAWLAFAIAEMTGPAAALDPMGALGVWPRAFTALCRPAFGLTVPADSWSFSGFAVVGLMWSAMVLAMMLPSAGPMIVTYAEIADTAARKREPIVSPFVLAVGYTVIWLSFAMVATVAQFGFTRAALLDADMTSASNLFSGVIFIAAGLYQFSALKHACLRRCRSPFSFFFANWQTSARGVFRLGVRQGLYCLGCCWAMMAVMFAVGVMNVIWMAALGIVMTIEKMIAGRRFSHAVGIVLIAGGLIFLVPAHWPLWPI
jgi:predicted metal-binding membrane protein